MMSCLTWKMRGLGAAFAVIGTMGFVSNADAIITRKVWDPQYGDGLPSLGWSGAVDFQIKDDCLSKIKSSGWINNLTPFTACTNKLSIQSASVNLYDLNDTDNNVLLSYDGASNIFGGDNANLAIRMYVEVNGSEKTLKAVQGGFLFPEFTDASFAKVAGFEGAAFWLNFNANETNDFSLGSNLPPDGDFAFLTSCSYRNSAAPSSDESYSSYSSAHKLDFDVSCSQNDGEQFPAMLRPIPEPETYMLALASFGVLGLWVRRRRQSAS
jgi:hypothetical protein